MKKKFLLKKIIFHISNIGLIFIYLYPGSIFGWLIYGNTQKQPQLTSDFVIFSSFFNKKEEILLSFLKSLIAESNTLTLSSINNSLNSCEPNKSWTSLVVVPADKISSIAVLIWSKLSKSVFDKYSNIFWCRSGSWTLIPTAAAVLSGIFFDK